MSLAVIGTFFRKHENTLHLLKRVLVESTRKPDEFWIMCEDDADEYVVDEALILLYENEMVDDLENVRVRILPTPTHPNGKYKVIPYSNKINHALDHTRCDTIVYLDNGSMPHERKFQIMENALIANPEWGAVYCGQKRTGWAEDVFLPHEVIEQGMGRLNFTQVMHRLTDDRWSLDMALANPDVADGHFWASLHETLGWFYPVGQNTKYEILDEHHMPGVHAEGCD